MTVLESAKTSDTRAPHPAADGPDPVEPQLKQLLVELHAMLLRREEGRRRAGDRRLLDRGGPDRRLAEASTATDVVEAGEEQPRLHLFVAALVAFLLLGLVAVGNAVLAPELYRPSHFVEIAAHLAEGRNYAVFDLNLETRALRREHIARLPRRPEVVILGASHWQEAHAGLLPGRDLYNAHVHRDYHEDLLAVTEMLVRQDRLPDTLVVSMRDMVFAPLAGRTDHLWRPALGDYRAMADRLGLPAHGLLEANDAPRLVGLISVRALVDHLDRWLTAPRQPGPTREARVRDLDLLLPDGSILWSERLLAEFTAERTRREVEHAIRERAARAPGIDPAAVEALDRLFGFLVERGVQLVLVHPPFNPTFYDAVQGTPYGLGLISVEVMTRALAARHGAVVIGGFDPARTGCTAEMYIDAEHANPDCLRRLLVQIPPP